MDRRSFLKASSAAPLALVPTVMPAGTRLSDLPTPQARAATAGANPNFTVLAKPPENAADRLMMGLSENVFTRLTQHCGHALRLDDKVDKLGSVTSRMQTIDLQMNCHVNIPGALAGEHPPEFMYDEFIERTEHWTLGQALQQHEEYMLDTDTVHRFSAEESPPNAHELLEGKRVCALMWLPQGCLFAGNYIDSQTGLAMRAVGVFDVSYDRYELRWDVLLG